MEARRILGFPLLISFVSLSGCALFQPRPSTGNAVPVENNSPPPREIVRATSQPASRPATDQSVVHDAPESVIQQWAARLAAAERSQDKSAAKRRPPPRAAGDAEFAVHEDSQIVAESTASAAVPPASADLVSPPKEPLPSATPITPSVAPAPAAEVARPPVVQGVNAAAAVELRERPESGAANATLNDPQAAATSATLKELMDRWVSQSGDDKSFRQQLDQRVLLALSGDTVKARAPLDMVTKEQQAMAARFVEALIAIHEGHGGEPGSEATRVLANVDQLREALLPSTDLSLPALTICRAVKGFGQYEPIEPAEFVAGRPGEFVAYCEIRDFISEKRTDGSFQSTFSMKLSVLSRAGDTVFEMSADEIIDRCRTRRRDCFLSPVVKLPATLGPGDYVIKITITDKVGKKVAEKTASLRLSAR